MKNLILTLCALLGVITTVALGIGIYLAMVWAGASESTAGPFAFMGAIAFGSVATMAFFDEASP
jgi:hypothetical protein